MSETKIEWTATVLPDGRKLPGYTFNPVWGCEEISPACAHCYARAWAKRLGMPELWEGKYRLFGDDHWREPLKWNRQAAHAGVRRRVFCASMADVFDNGWPDGIRERLWALIQDTPHLDYLLLTKRIGNVRKMLEYSLSSVDGAIRETQAERAAGLPSSAERRIGDRPGRQNLALKEADVRQVDRGNENDIVREGTSGDRAIGVVPAGPRDDGRQETLRGGSPLGLEALREAARALNEARRGASWSGDADLIRTAQHAIDDAIEMCSVKNWEGNR